MNQNLHVFATRSELNSAVAEAVVLLARRTITERGVFHLALAGGSTPREVYACLAQSPFCNEMPWENVHVYFGDERTVPPHHEQSNFGMAHATLLSKVSIPPNQVHRIRGEDNYPAHAAAEYEQDLKSSAPMIDGWPSLDLVLLGIGADGHVASLFPDTPAVQERVRAVTAVQVSKLNTWRITVTFPVIHRAKQVFMVAVGAEKSAIVQEALDFGAVVRYPVQQVRSTRSVEWFLDAAAAQRLESTKATRTVSP